MLVHERAPVKSLRELEEHWSVDDLLSANIALDVIDSVERRAAEKAQRDQEIDTDE